MIKEKLQAFINEQFPEPLIRVITDDIYAAFARSDEVSQQELQSLGHERLRAYMRRELCNDVLARHGEVKSTNPKGEQYGFLQLNSMNMLVFCVDKGLAVRPAMYRKQLSEMNKVLSPVIPDLFDPQSELVRSSLHTCLMVVIPKGQGGNSRHPENILLTVPYSDYKGFHLVVPLDEWLKSYGEQTADVNDPWPTFREELRKIEQDGEGQ